MILKWKKLHEPIYHYLYGQILFMGFGQLLIAKEIIFIFLFIIENKKNLSVFITIKNKCLDIDTTKK